MTRQKIFTQIQLMAFQRAKQQLMKCASPARFSKKSIYFPLKINSKMIYFGLLNPITRFCSPVFTVSFSELTPILAERYDKNKTRGCYQISWIFVTNGYKEESITYLNQRLLNLITIKLQRPLLLFSLCQFHRYHCYYCYQRHVLLSMK